MPESPMPPDAFTEGLNPPQAQAVTHRDGALLVVAGPGSGKTRVITHRIAALIAEGVDPWAILAVTFTNKAAAEMSERVADLLGAGARLPAISTFHSACVKVLRRFPQEAGLPKSFVIADADDARRLVAKVLAGLDQETDPSEAKKVASMISWAKNHMKTPDDLAHGSDTARLAAVVAPRYQQMLTESGMVDFDDLLLKCRTLLLENDAVREFYARRLRYVLVDEFQDTNPVQYDIARALASGTGNLCVVGDPQQCHPVGSLVRTDAGDVPVEQLDGSSLRLAGFDGERDGYRFSVDAREFTGDLLQVTAGSRTVTVSREHRIPAVFAADQQGYAVVLSLFAGHATVGVHPVGALPAVARASMTPCWLLAGFDQRAQAEQFAADTVTQLRVHDPLGAPDRVAQLLGTHGRSRSRPAWGPTAAPAPMTPVSLPAGVDPDTVVTLPADNLVTGLAQVLVDTGDGALHPAPVSSVGPAGYAGPLFSLEVPVRHTYVCDGVLVHNSIYSWRGSLPEIVEKFLADSPDATVVRLEQNYRSTGAIVELARQVIALDDSTVPFSSRTDADWGHDPVAVVCDDDVQEAKWVADWLQSVDGDAAILVRTNAQTRPFEEALTRARIAHQVVGTLRFWERAEVKDALAWLRVAVNGQDQLAFERASGAPSRGVGPSALAHVRERAEADGCTLPQALTAGCQDGTFPARSRAALAGFADALGEVTTAARSGPQAALRAVVAKTGMDVALRKTEEGRERLENLSELIRAADGYEANLEGVSTFLEQVALSSSTDEAKGAGAVFLMTVHAAKGKEFDNVVVAGAEEGFFPHVRSSASVNRKELNEERRLLYVAITRARRRLALTRAQRRFRFGRWVDTGPSPLLTHIDPDALRWKPLTAPRRDLRRTFGQGGANPGMRRDARRPARSSGTFASSQSGGPRPSRRASASRPLGAASSPKVPPAVSGPRLDPSQVSVGAKVSHPSFGDGDVTAVSESRLTVRFADRERVLDLQFAPLTLLS